LSADSPDYKAATSKAGTNPIHVLPTFSPSFSLKVTANYMFTLIGDQ
jgi:hypothetical protein